MFDWFFEAYEDIQKLGGWKKWFVTVADKRKRKGRHSTDYIHLFYIDPKNYVGAHA